MKKLNFEYDFYLTTYVINLKERTDRRSYIIEQFRDKPEFKVHFIDAVKHSIGAVGLWLSMVEAVKDAIEQEEDIVVICEDDHTFTSAYSKQYLLACITDAYQKGAELLSGGIGGFGMVIPVSLHLYWMDWFWCTQFIVIYKPLFKRIVDYSFKDNDTADGVFSLLANKKMTLYPFVSIQKDFGYSDVTSSNHQFQGLISSHFSNAYQRLSVIHQINCHYNYGTRVDLVSNMGNKDSL